MTSHNLTGKIVIAASFKNVSPFVIGKGKSLSELTDGDVVTDNNKNPYIPASSFAGKLKAFIKSHLDSPANNVSEYFWGTDVLSGGQEYQSHLSLEDVKTFDNYSVNKIRIRDGVKINNKKGTAEPGAKYNYQIVEPELYFYLKAEVTIRENINPNEIINSITLFYTALTRPDFRIGALTNHGFGKIEVQQFHVWHFDFKINGMAKIWFQYLKELHKLSQINKDYFMMEPQGIKWLELSHKDIPSENSFRIAANFNLKNSLIIGTYGTDINDADKKHLRSNGKSVITGKSIRGALRNRAERIINTLGSDAEIIRALFGEVNEDDRSKTKKGKLRIEEVVLDTSEDFTQSRTKIDRFTGGVMSGALFNSEPVRTGDQVRVQFTITKQPSSAEKGLLLLLLKDLWTEDLAIGGEKGIGRGILKGLSATITDDNVETVIELNAVDAEKAKLFNGYVSSLINRPINIDQ